jgi:hypothetical protein
MAKRLTRLLEQPVPPGLDLVEVRRLLAVTGHGAAADELEKRVAGSGDGTSPAAPDADGGPPCG